ncbi:hypothetical protein [Rhodococcus sp. P1Y]|uniref:hypothetical protein n=1 Tax=Rhodococcus sp. P1Y TaxID=1302308 RepID=UPI001293A610|nr:hypothetical protein [Rhodococcus sp. P1Y]
MSTRRWRLGHVGICAAVLILVAACTIPTNTVDGSAVAQSDSGTPPPIVPTANALEAPPPSASSMLRDEFEAIASSYSGRLGMAYVPVGGGQVQVLGDWSTGVAWSTIKVPLAVAALRQVESSSLSSATSAIIDSDNGSAEDLWSSLGDPSSAALAVEQVLIDGGDGSTDVQENRVRSGYTPFGQTEWSLPSQAQFASELQCVDGGASVVELMHQISSDQSWGLGHIAGSAFKGGWGPAEDGSYLVRQLGIVDVADGFTAVAIAAEPESGSFSDGTVMLDVVAEMLADHPELLPYGRCA